MAMLADVRFWVVIKFLLVLATIPGLFRYPAAFVPAVFCMIAYSGPATIGEVIFNQPFTISTKVFWLLSLTLTMLALGLRLKRYELMLLSSVLANSYMMKFVGAKYYSHDFWAGVPGADGATYEISLVAFSSIFVLQLIAGVLYLRDSTNKESFLQPLEAVITHIFAALGVYAAQHRIAAISGYEGVSWIIISLFSFGAALALKNHRKESIYSEVLLNLSLLISAVGILLQVKGAWTAIVFLLYSCVVVYFSISFGTVRTRVYSFLVLTVSLGKLYFECSELFDSVSGTTAVAIVGVILLALSFKLEKRALPSAKKGSG